MATKIFISYSHKDQGWKDKLLLHLRVLERRDLVEIWDASALQTGTDWSNDIPKAIRHADVAILLISDDFLASDFVVEKELPALFERHQQNRIVVLPILISPSLWSVVPQLARFQFLNDPSKPLAVLSEHESDVALASIGQKIITVVEGLSEQGVDWVPEPRKISRELATDAPKDQFLFVSHSKIDGDFAELLKLKLEGGGYSAWIDIDRLGPGVDWRVEIDDAIKNSIAMIAVMSPDARASEYVTYEWAFAWGSKIKIIPIMLRQTTMHPRLATWQFLDFTNRIARPWRQLFGAIALEKKGK